MKSTGKTELRSEYRRNNAGTAGTVRFDPAKKAAKRRLDLFELVTWAFRDQMVDRVTGRGLFEAEREVDGARDAGSGASRHGRVEDIARLGCMIDGGQWKGLNDRVHPDAVAVADRVTHAVIVEFARMGEGPEWPMTRPRAWPHLADRQRDMHWGWMDLSRYRHADEWRAAASLPSRRVDIRILVAERWAETIIDREWDERKHKMVERPRIEIHDVEYCPLHWSPSVEWIMAQQGVYQLWHHAMVGLGRAMASVTLRDHEVTGFSAATYW